MGGSARTQDAATRKHADASDVCAARDLVLAKKNNIILASSIVKTGVPMTGVSKHGIPARSGAPTAAVSSWRSGENPHGVGGALEVMRAQLLKAGKKLEGCVEPAGRELVGETSRMLEKQQCRVAVVGQIKAGKSSFVNAFVQQPELLPTDINPWTTAVTNLHFNSAPPGGNRGHFRFFSEQEWKQLVDGGGRLRELTKRLVPGFEPELLRQHVEALRRRAKTRLGPQFHTLLGQAHQFSGVEADVLGRYVCSGSFSVSGASASDQGQYSDITKSADLYFDRGPFAYPMTFVDTPGTNDPFLLRDEVTRSTLESADLYIVVLTARQPLADSDVALLRILRGLHKDRILVFINRIDDLANIARDSAEVIRFVRKRIEAEFPDAEIPVIAGSARWASFALHPTALQFDHVVQPRVLQFLSDIGAYGNRSVDDVSWERDGRDDKLLDALYLASGMPAAYEALSGMLGTSHCAHVLRQVAQCYGELSRGARIAARGELDELNTAHARVVSSPADATDSLRKIEAELRQLTSISGVIETSARNLERQLRDIIREEMDAMHTRMSEEVSSQAREEGSVLVDTLRRGRVPKVWRCEVGDLRGRLNRLFLEGFQRAAARVLDVQSRVSPELRQLTEMLAAGSELPEEPTRDLMEIPAPSVASLGRFIALDLDVPWWKAWWSRSPRHEEMGHELAKLVVTEFEPVVAELVKTAEGGLERYCMMTLRWSFAMCRNLIQSLQQRGERLRATSETLSKNVGGQADPDAVRTQGQRIAQLRDTAGVCESLSREFALICATLDKFLQRVPGTQR